MRQKFIKIKNKSNILIIFSCGVNALLRALDHLTKVGLFYCKV